MSFIYNDGGRIEAGFKTQTDCGIRALSIACEISYKEARAILKKAAKNGKQENGQIAGGIYKEDLDSALEQFGFKWHSAPKFKGRKAKYYDLPKGRIVARMSKHFVAVIDKQLHDTWDSSEKMVYGYWKQVT